MQRKLDQIASEIQAKPATFNYRQAGSELYKVLTEANNQYLSHPKADGAKMLAKNLDILKNDFRAVYKPDPAGVSSSPRPCSIKNC